MSGDRSLGRSKADGELSRLFTEFAGVVDDATIHALNRDDRHKDKPEGQRTRGKRTIAKEKLYKVINAEIRAIYPNFNIGTTTGAANGASDRWVHPYRHWRFMPRNHAVRPELGKNASGRKS